jgi:hypothetical protein
MFSFNTVATHPRNLKEGDLFERRDGTLSVAKEVNFYEPGTYVVHHGFSQVDVFFASDLVNVVESVTKD